PDRRGWRGPQAGAPWEPHVRRVTCNLAPAGARFASRSDPQRITCGPSSSAGGSFVASVFVERVQGSGGTIGRHEAEEVEAGCPAPHLRKLGGRHNRRKVLESPTEMTVQHESHY